MVSTSFSCSLLLVLFLSFVVSSYSIQTVKIEDICQKVMENKTFCLSFLKSKPGGAESADLISLGLYTVDTTRTNLTNTLNLINSLLKNTTDHNLTALYNDCKEQYGDSSQDINTAKTCFKTQSCYNQVNQIASAILDAADDCAGNGNIPLSDNNPLKNNSLVLGDLSDIILVISNFLMQK